MILVKDGACEPRHSWAMRASFHVAALSDEQVPQAFPLIQATWPGADLAAWRTFVRFFNRAAARNAGVLAVRDRADCICGVLAYRLDHDLQAGPVLAVQLFTAVNLMNSPRTVQALLDAAEARAYALRCAGIQIRLYGDQAGLGSRLRALGLSYGSGLFWKPLDAAKALN